MLEGVGGGESRGGGPAGGMSVSTGRIERPFCALDSLSFPGDAVFSGNGGGSSPGVSGGKFGTVKPADQRGEKKEKSVPPLVTESGLLGESGLCIEAVKDISGSRGDCDPRRGVKLGGIGKLKRVLL